MSKYTVAESDTLNSITAKVAGLASVRTTPVTAVAETVRESTIS